MFSPNEIKFLLDIKIPTNNLKITIMEKKQEFKEQKNRNFRKRRQPLKQRQPLEEEQTM